MGVGAGQGDVVVSVEEVLRPRGDLVAALRRSGEAPSRCA
jgi:hypothetical protein